MSLQMSSLCSLVLFQECESGQGLDRLDPIPTCFLMFLMEVVKLWMTDGVVKPLLVPAQ